MQQTDILASQPITSSGALQDQASNNLGRTRVRAIYIVAGATAGSVVLKDGGASGSTIATVNTVGSATTPQYIRLPSQGLLFRTSVYAAITNAASVMVFYG
jgi:hypothetical protein